ncbi:alcohol dehydrogenase, class IV [Bifidobacterium dolichotidis]|uniref:Alcohol dehydrogenase, class IV n=1 Tax=Bifidobacterium dolichotidis TaxID=2306976 RepID=A0A430FS85_9BIFI|nr:alcohol dehydrogenase [Bifidobacterium dolichotidis]RSX55731.1 alcohol dehydrogenase, class IV [Bifidobacterium dolichotidis]
MTRKAFDKTEAPWSHRLSTGGRAGVTVLSAFGSGVIGTLVHRLGATQNIPIGLVLGFLLVGMSAWCARSRGGVTGLALHLIVCSSTVGFIAVYVSQGDVLIPLSISGGVLPFLSREASLIWFLGVVILQIVMAVLPNRWFYIPDGNEDEADMPHEAVHHDMHNPMIKRSNQDYAAFHVGPHNKHN